MGKQPGSAAVKRELPAASPTPTKRRLQRKQSGLETPPKELLDSQSTESTYHGPRDADGRPHGFGKISHPQGSYVGELVHGALEGKGELKFVQGDSYRGCFKAGQPEGWCAFFNASEQTSVRGNYVSGKLHGLAEKYDQDGKLVFRGRFVDDAPMGMVEVFDEYGGRIIGRVNDQFGLTAQGFVYVFPDGRTALAGTFMHGQFVSGRYALLYEALPRPRTLSPEEDAASWMKSAEEVIAPVFKLSESVPDEVYKDVSTATAVSGQPTVPDLYEAARVAVRQSTAHPGMEGLFAHAQIADGDLCSWYTGVRLTNKQVEGRGGIRNAATIPLDEEVVLDMPPELANRAQFCSCLGHKAQHSAQSNAKYDLFDHPRFGMIRAIRATKSIGVGEEILCDNRCLGDLDELPKWYMASHEDSHTQADTPARG